MDATALGNTTALTAATSAPQRRNRGTVTTRYRRDMADVEAAETSRSGSASLSRHPMNTRTATTASAAATTTRNTTLIGNGFTVGLNLVPAADRVLHSPKVATINSVDRNSSYHCRIWMPLPVFVLQVLLLFSAGFGFGILYSKQHQSCQCSTVNENNFNGAIATATPTNQSSENENATTHCQSVRDDTSTTGSSSGSSSSDSGSFTLPPVDDASSTYLPPVYTDPNAVTCLDDAQALDELKMVVTTLAHLYINEFANYIRMGGNNSHYVENEFVFGKTDLADMFRNGTNSSNETPGHERGSRQTQSAFTFMSTVLRPNWRKHAPLDGRPSQKVPLQSQTHSPRPFSHDDSLPRWQRPANSRQRGSGDDRGGRRRRMQSSNSYSTSRSGTSSDETAVVLVADVIQTSQNGDLVYMAHGNEVMMLQSATTAVQSVLRVPTRHDDSVICGLLLLPLSAPTKNTENDLDAMRAAAPAATDDEILVVLVQESEFTTITVGSSDTSLSNITVLVYYPNDDMTEGHTLKLVQRYSLPGNCDGAFAVPAGQGGHDVHVVTTTELDMHALTLYLSPANLQTNSSAWYSNDAPKLVLNESEYRKLAYAQLERSVDDIVGSVAAGYNARTNGPILDCTGFVALSRLRNKDTNLGLDIPSSLVHIASFDLSSISSEPYSTAHKGSISMLPPSSMSIWNRLVSETRLFMACEIMSGQTLTIESLPLIWIVTFDLVNATVQPMTVSGLVPGAIAYDLGLDLYQANGKDYLRLVTTHPDNVIDFYARYSDVDVPFPSMNTVLQILQVSGNGNDSDDNDGLMPLVGELTLFQGSCFSRSSVSRQDFMMLAAAATDSRFNTTGHTVFTIDTSDPSNPHVVGELFIPAKAMELYSVDANWIVGVSSYGASNEDPFPQPLQLWWWNASDPLNLAFHWMDDNVLAPNGTGIISSVLVNLADDNYDIAAAIRFIKESNVLVLPMRTERYKTKRCQSNYWMYGHYNPDWTSHNESLYNGTCWYDQETVLDGFWVFKVDLAPVNARNPSTTTRDGSYSGSGSGSSIRNITKHFEINHVSQDLLPRDCMGSFETLPTRTLAFNGDVMTMKGNAILSHDLLTKSKAAPAVILTSTDCN